MGKCHSKRVKQSLYVRDKEGNVLTDSHKAQQRRQRERERERREGEHVK